MDLPLHPASVQPARGRSQPLRTLVVSPDVTCFTRLRQAVRGARSPEFVLSHARELGVATARLRSRHFDAVVLDVADMTDPGAVMAALRAVAPDMAVVTLSHRELGGCASLVHAGAQDCLLRECLLRSCGASQQLVRLALQNAVLRLRAEQQIASLARQDPLTGLPNRAVLEEEIARAQTRSRRSGQPWALLYLDLDGFKSINDTLGHAVGDAALVETARRLQKAQRASDMVARLGGDEFAVLAEGLSAPADATAVAQKLQRSLAQRCQIDQRLVSLRASIGVVIVATESHEPPSATLAHADAAMYEAKRAGGGRCCVFGSAGASAAE